MKRSIIAAILGVAGSVATTYGQGIIQFDNYYGAVYDPVVYGAGVAGHAAGSNVNSTSVEVALFYALGNLSSDSTSAFLTAAGSAVGTTFIDSTLNSHGLLGTGTGPGGFYNDGTDITLAGWVTGDTATFMVEAWDTTAGGTFSTAGNLIGSSALWTEVGDPSLPGLSGTGIIPSSLGDPAETMANGPLGVVMTQIVPEPTTLALAGLGGLASLMAFRRKQV
jgi:hypothetical protein